MQVSETGYITYILAEMLEIFRAEAKFKKEECRRGVIAELANDIAWNAVGAQIEPYLRQHA